MTNIRLTNEEFAFASKHLTLIEQIVKTSAASNIPADFRETLLETAVKYKWSNCKCNSSIYIATCRLYNSFLYTKQQIKNERSASKRSKTNRETKTNTGNVETGQGETTGTDTQSNPE